MCELCRQYRCPASCPNAEEPPVVEKCIHCGDYIREGEDYYDIDGAIWCEECIDNSRKTAELPEPDYEPDYD